MKYYTIFIDGQLLQQITGDVNSNEDFATSGLLWENKDLAKKALEDLEKYNNILRLKDKLEIKEVEIT